MDILVDDSLFVSLMHHYLLLLLVSLMSVSFMDDWNMLLFNESLMFFMDYRLMVLMDVLLNNHWLMMLMDNFLMMFVNNIFLVFNHNILVMLMNHILMDFLDNWLSNVGPHFSSKFMLLDILTFISFLNNSFLLMLHYDWLLVDFLYDGLTLELR